MRVKKAAEAACAPVSYRVAKLGRGIDRDGVKIAPGVGLCQPPCAKCPVTRVKRVLRAFFRAAHVMAAQTWKHALNRLKSRLGVSSHL